MGATPISVTTEEQLTDAIAGGAERIQLVGDIRLSKYLNIDHKTVTIDLNGHKLSGKPTAKGIYINSGRKVVLK